MGTPHIQDRRFNRPPAWLAVLAAGFGFLFAIAAAAATEHPELDADLAGACTECHDDLLEGSTIHPPADGDCDSCHEMTVDDDTWSVALAAPPEKICLMCHDNPAEIPDAESTHYPAAEGECLVCHNPHSSNQAFMIRGKGNDVCFECHIEQQEAMEKPSVHDVATDLGCPVCHEPHASANPHLLRMAGNDLCMECHAAGPETARIDETGGVVLFGGRTVDPAYFQSIPKLTFPGGTRIGHPVSRHPVQGDSDPRRPGQPFGCISCHDPHGSDREPLLVGGKGFGLCRQCHKK